MKAYPVIGVGNIPGAPDKVYLPDDSFEKWLTWSTMHACIQFSVVLRCYDRRFQIDKLIDIRTIGDIYDLYHSMIKELVLMASERNFL